MTTTELAPEILPTDSKGRVRVTRERREQLLDEFERSGLTGAQFARAVGLKYQTFAFWRQERRQRRPALAGPPARAKAAPVAWLETVIEQAQAQAAGPGAGAPLLVRLPSGVSMEVAGAAQASVAAALLRAWEKTPC